MGSHLADAFSARRRAASRRGATRAALICALAMFSGAARSAEPPRPIQDPFLDQLAGRWDLNGSVHDKPVHYSGEGRWVLHHGWLLLSLADVAVPPAYEADVYLGIDPTARDYVAHWLDRFGAAGARVVATGHRDGQALVLFFPYEDSTFRDTFTIAADSATATLLIESRNADGSWSTFASFTLTRPR